MKEEYQLFAKQNNIKERSLKEKYDELFIKDINTYMNLVIHSKNMKNKFMYKTQEGIIFNFPYLGVVGLIGMSNLYYQPIFTCIRYSMFDNLLKEKEQGEVVLKELIDRIEKAEKVIPSLTGEKLEKSKQFYYILKENLNYILVGLELLENMKLYLENKQGTLDDDNESAYKWKLLRSSNIKEGRWGF